MTFFNKFDKSDQNMTTLNQVWQVLAKFDKFDQYLTRLINFGLIQYDMTWPFIDMRDMIYDYLTWISDKRRRRQQEKIDSKMGAYAPIKIPEDNQ